MGMHLDLSLILLVTGGKCFSLWQLLFWCCVFLTCLMNSQVEKFRPKLIKDIVGNSEAVARLQVIGSEGNMPNLILSVRTSSTRLH